MIEAPVSKFRKNNLKLYIVFCFIGAIIFAYDGYLSEYSWSGRRSFYEEHVKDGKADEDMIFNRYAPIFLVGLAGFLACKLSVLKNRKLIADENELIFNDKEKIQCDSIQKIDKTHFDSKGHFIITYRLQNGKDSSRKISSRSYDNLQAVLDHLIAKIS